MQVNGSTQTLSSPRAEQNKEIFETLSRVYESRAEVRKNSAAENRAAEVEAAKPEIKKTSFNLEEVQKMVLRPSEVPLEERMSQVVSLEDIQRLLLLRAPVGGGDQSLRGNFVDRMA